LSSINDPVISDLHLILADLGRIAKNCNPIVIKGEKPVLSLVLNAFLNIFVGLLPVSKTPS
jgi:hypothetical protein